MSTAKQIRDDVRSAVAAVSAVASRSIVPSAAWVPQFDRGDTLPAIIVAPASREQVILNRGAIDSQTMIQVAVLEDLGSDPEAAGTAGHVLLQAIIDALLGKRLSGASGAMCVAAMTSTLNSGDAWREKQMFVAAVELRFR